MMRDEFALAQCPHCGGEVRIPVLGWASSYKAIIGETTFGAQLGTAKCTKRCLLTREDEKNLVITDYRWEDW